MSLDKNLLLSKIEKVMDRLINLGGGDYSKDKCGDHDVQFTGLVERDFGIEEWDWPQGVGLMGLVKLQEYYGDTRYDDFFTNWYKRNYEIGLPSRNVNTTKPFETLFNLAVRTGNETWLQECAIQAEFLLKSLPRTPEGGFQHVTSGIGDRNGVILNENQLWVDTLFMAVLFLNKYGQYTGNAEYVSTAVQQFLIHIKYLYDKQTGLFYHGWSFDRMDNFGGIFWARGNCWFTLGVTEFLADCDNIRLDDGVKAYILDTFRAQAKALAKCQAESGLWHTVLLDSTSYEEVSGTAGFAAGMIRGYKEGFLNDSYLPCIEKAVMAICANVAEDGNVLNVSAGTAIGMNADFYKNIVIRPMAYGQSLSLIALIEALGL